jgi:putative transposase
LIRSYKFRAYQTLPQEGRSDGVLRDHCDLYDAALLERREAWRMRKANISYEAQSAQLKEIRRADPDGQGRHSFTAQQQTLRRLKKAFDAFFRRCAAGEKPGYPRFKPYARFNQVLFVAGDGAKWTPAGDGKWARAYFQAVGSVKVKQHRPVLGTVKTLTLRREYRRWYVIVDTDSEPVPLPATGREVGVDVGVARFLTTSDGEVVANPRFLAASAEVIADLQRRKFLAKPGSGNRKRIVRALAREYRKVRNRRRDFHHKTARALVNSCDVIALEKLNTDGMTRRPKPKPDPGHPGGFLPNGGAAKAGLNKSILDASWFQFMTILAAKAESAGRRVTLVNAAYTSIDCHQCGRRCTRPCQDTVICPVHGAIDADVNGARNVYSRAGLGSGQAARAA